jgi:hypothetical protein
VTKGENAKMCFGVEQGKLTLDLGLTGNTVGKWEGEGRMEKL